MKERLVGALVGFGDVVEYGHLPGYREHPRFEIGAVVDPDAGRRARAREILGAGVRFYSGVTALLAEERLDFVDVATPPAARVEAIECFARSGAHVLAEKPLAPTRRGAERARRAAERAGTALLVVHNWHHSPTFCAATEALEAGAIGTPAAVEFVTERSEPAGGAASWRLDAKVAGGGILMDHGWHQLYLARTFLGRADPESVQAQTERRRWTRGSVEDTADCTVRFQGGAVARLRMTWAAPARRTVVTVYGTDGRLRIEHGAVTVSNGIGRDRSWPVVPEAPDDSYHAAWFPRVLDAFAEATRDPGCVAENWREAWICQTVIDAAYRSSEQGGAEVRIGA